MSEARSENKTNTKTINILRGSAGQFKVNPKFTSDAVQIVDVIENLHS